MKKFTIRFAFLIVISIILSSVLNISVPINVLSTFYTVAGIMFSIGLGVIAGFDLRDIKDRESLSDIRNNIDKTRNFFILIFAIATFGFLVHPYLNGKCFFLLDNQYISLQFNCAVFILLIVLFSIFYFILNFLELQTLRNQIIDKILEESEK